MTSSYSANIVVNVQNQKSLERTAATVGRLNSLVKQLKPINLLAPGRGAGADAVKVAMTEVIKKAKLANNSIAGISATFAGASSQASAFSEILANVKIDKLKAGKTLLESQNAEVQELASAFAKAEGKAGELQKRYQGLLQAARQAEGLAIGPATELGTLEAELQKRAYYEQQITEEKREQQRLEKEAAVSARSRTRDAARRSETRRRDILTGAGFPLLFGGGPLQALAGGIGGAAGGLGGSIAASAITAQVEAFAKDTAAVGQALNSTSGALELMREKSLFSKDATKELAAELEGLGEIEKLSTLLTTELVQKIGNEGVTALQDLGTESDKTTRLWSALTLQLQALIAGPLKDFFALINSVLGAVTTSGQFKVLESELTGQARTDFDADVASRRAANLAATASGTEGAAGMMSSMGTAGGVGVLSPADQRELVEKYLPKLQVTADIPDLGGVKPPKTKVEKDRLPSLNIELGLKERLLVLNQKIAQAVLNEDKVSQTLLEKEKIRETLVADIDKIKTKGLKADVEAKEIAIARVGAAQSIQDIDSQAAQAKAQEAKKVEELVGNLENEGALIKAKLNGREDEVRLTQEIAEKTEGLEKADATRVENLIRGNAELEKQAAIADRMQQIYDQIGQSIASGVVDTLSAAVDQTKSLADAAANTLRNVANILLQLGINTALQGTGFGIFKNLSGFANGGRPPVGKPSIVGERGPELFVPNTSGTIVPNNKLSGGGATNVVVNVDAKGSSASGDSGAGKQLGGLIGAAVQAELIKQQRPGGLLSR